MAIASATRTTSVNQAHIDARTQRARARKLLALHAGPDVLVLANAWDVGSAVLLSALPGVQAVATTSAGVAATHGVPDGERLAFDQTLILVAQMCRAVPVPVTVDLEAGYGASPAHVADSVASVAEAGAAGVNLEDGDPDPAHADRLLSAYEHAERITAAWSAARHLDTPLVVNARTDVYWRGVGSPRERFAETVRRLRLYADSGADCVFVPGFPGPGVAPARQRRMIRELVAALDGVPLNLLSASTALPVAELAELGVRRLSVGSALYRLSMAAARDAMAGLLHTGRPQALDRAEDLSYPDLARALTLPDEPAEG